MHRASYPELAQSKGADMSLHDRSEYKSGVHIRHTNINHKFIVFVTVI